MPTIREVAEKSGVSTATVSRVLSGGAERQRCSAEVIARVEMIARDLGYRVNYHMRSVRKKRSDVIGYITERRPYPAGDDAGGWYFDQILEGVQASVHATGRMVMQIRSDATAPDDATSALQRGLNFIQERRLDGFILPGMLSKFQGRMGNELTDEIPVAVVEPGGPTRWSTVLFDEVSGIKQIIDHLFSLGHKRLLWLGPSEPIWATRTNVREQMVLRAAFATGAQGHCCYYEDSKKMSLSESAQRAEDAVLKYLSAAYDPFTAIIAYNDLAALGACRALARKGISVPHQVSVTGFDDHCAALAWPPLTTVTHELFEMGYFAAQVVMEMIDAEPARREELRQSKKIFTPKLVTRESTGPARL